MAGRGIISRPGLAGDNHALQIEGDLHLAQAPYIDLQGTNQRGWGGLLTVPRGAPEDVSSLLRHVVHAHGAVIRIGETVTPLRFVDELDGRTLLFLAQGGDQPKNPPLAELWIATCKACGAVDYSLTKHSQAAATSRSGSRSGEVYHPTCEACGQRVDWTYRRRELPEVDERDTSA
jgi:hypothetical protein